MGCIGLIHRRGQLRQKVTIGTLPDDVLLKIFKSFVDTMYFWYLASEKWHTLVHICRRWRSLVFTSPRHLNLQLLCRPPKRSVKEMLDIWPELPIYIYDLDHPTNGAGDNVAAALSLNRRVCRIRLERTSESAWETFAPLMRHPFPVLTHLWVQPYLPIENAISRPFLGGSAPCLRDLVLIGVPFPALPELLLSATNLIHLWYDDLPPSGYIPPQAMATGLSALTRLESLSLTFLSPRPFSDEPEAIRLPPPHTHTHFSALTYIRFWGDPEYIEDLVAQIDAPLLESMVITLFHQEVLEVSQLAKFVRRADKLSLLDRAEVTFSSSCISVTFSQESLVRVDPKTLILNAVCPEWDLRLSYLAQFCESCLPTLFPFECLHIHVPLHHMWRYVVEGQDTQWLELLRPFNTVKHLHLSKQVAPCIAQALRGLSARRVMDLLPALEIIFISGLEGFGPVKEAISEYSDARQCSGHTVSIHDWEGGVHYVGKQGNGSRGW